MANRDWRRVIGYALRRPARSSRALLTRDGWSGVYWFVAHTVSRRSATTTRPISQRSYRSYDSYLSQQRSKLALVDLDRYDTVFRQALAERMRTNSLAGRTVLCLAARIGTEVKAFHDVGAFAVGIDLNPGRANQWVLPGDFHRLVFPDASVDVVYCNSLDHAFDLPRVVGEARRVLKPHGVFLVDAQRGASEVTFDAWSATSWQSIDDLAKAVQEAGLRLIAREPIDAPWIGEQLTFRKQD